MIEFMRFSPHNFSLRQIQYFVAVAHESSFRKAAKRCAVSQPSLSAQIAELEHALSLKLFDRGRRNVQLTIEGKKLLAEAERLLYNANAFENRAHNIQNPKSLDLIIGAIPTIAPYFIPQFDQVLRAEFPSIKLRWIEEKTEDLVKAIQKGKIDAALLALESEIEDLDYRIMTKDEFYLAIPSGHPLSQSEKTISRTELKNHEVLLLDEGHCFRDQALDFCAIAGAKESNFRATSMGTLVQMVIGGEHITLLPRSSLTSIDSLINIKIRPFKNPIPKRTIIFAWKKNAHHQSFYTQMAELGKLHFENHH